MAGIEGRNTAASWIVGVLCVGVVGLLVWFATPLLPMVGDMFSDLFGGGAS